MKKKWFRETLSLLLAGLLLLSSCGGQGDREVTSDDTGGGTTGSSEVTTTGDNDPSSTTSVGALVEYGVTKFKIVYPDEPDEVTFSAVKKLISTVEKKTGVTLAKTSDLIRRGQEHDPDTYEILVGLTNYDQTAEVLKNIGYGDYVVKWVGHKLVVTGRTPADVLLAANYLCNMGLKKAKTDAGEVYSVEDFTFTKERKLKELTVSGNDISDYTIVAGDKELLDAAEILQRNISESYGPVLPVRLRADVPETEKEIRVYVAGAGDKDACKALEYGYRVDGKTLLFFSGGAHSAKLAASSFAFELARSGETIRLEDGNKMRTSERAGLPKTEGADYRIMTANILAEFPTWGSTTPVRGRAEILRGILDEYSPDVVGLQEVTPLWYTYWNEIIGSKYAFVYPDTPDGLTNYSSIIYKKDKFDVVEDGLHYYTPVGKNNIRLVTWVVLKDKSNGRLLALFNTHWSWGSEKTSLTPEEMQYKQLMEEAEIVKTVREKYNCPVFCTADYNCKQDTTNYYAFIEAANVEDAKVLARKAGTLLTENGGCGTLGMPHESVNSIDHIFVTPGMQILSFNTVLNCQSASLSDHSPKYADIVYPKD